MTNRPFPVDATMSAVAIAYRNKELIHGKALPPVPVVSETFSWLEYPVGEAFTVPDLEVGRKARPGQVEFSAEEREAKTRDYGIDDAIPMSDVREAARAREAGTSTVDPIGTAVSGLSHLIQLGREVRTAAIVQNPDNYDASRKTSLAGTAKFSDYANSDPFGVLEEGMMKPLLHRANTIIMGQDVWSTTKRHPKLIKAVKGGLTEDGAISRVQFAELLEVEPERLLIGMGMVNLARKGQPVDLKYVWGNSIQLLYLEEHKSGPKDGVMTWGFTAECGGPIAGKIDDADIGIEGGFRVRVAEKVRELVCAKSLGYRIGTVI